MAFLSSQSSRARCAALILGRQARIGRKPTAGVHRHIHKLASPGSSPLIHDHLPSSYATHGPVHRNNTNARHFSVKNRQRNEEKRRKRKEKREAKKKEEESQKQEEKPSTEEAPPIMVTQTKASAKAEDEPVVVDTSDQEGGFTIAARPPDEEEDDEEFESRFSMPDREKEQKIGQMQNQVASLYKSGRYQEGLTIAQETLKETVDHFGESHPATGSSYLNVGLFHKQLGDFTQALEQYEKALKAYEETVGKEHESYAMVLHNLGILYQSRLHFDEQLQTPDRRRLAEKALEALEAAYRIRSVELPPTHPLVVATQSALGSVMVTTILSQHKRVGKDVKKTAPGAASYRSLLPETATEQSWAAAEGHLRDALDKAVQNPRGESSLNRKDNNHYLNVQRKLELKQKMKLGGAKQNEDAEYVTQTASAATASQNLAVFLKARSTTVHTTHPQYRAWVREARDLYEQTLEVRTKLLPTGHPDTYATQHSLAELLDYTGQKKEAEKLRESILETYFPPEEEMKKKGQSA